MKKRDEQKEMDIKFLLVVAQIALMIGMTFSICYFVHEEDKSMNIQSNSVSTQNNNSGIFLKLLGIFDKIVFNEKTLVSASDQVMTCPQTKNDSVCQEFLTSDCNDQCAVPCVPTRLSDTSVCQQGTCYSNATGSCTTGATKGLCESSGGIWSNDPFGNTPECKKGCCILGDSATFESKTSCQLDSQRLGTANFSLIANFRPEVDTEWACLALSKTQVYGACLIKNDVVNTCKFTTELDCKTSLKGDFKSNVLCSNPALLTNCKSQQTVACADGKDEVYWYDSCGNRENIYEGSSQEQKTHSYNNGIVLQKSDACSLVNGGNFLANQKTCGNCDRILGSVCGNKTSTQYLTGVNSNSVCTDLSCIDENGKKRVNGESWCNYQGSVGTDAGSGGWPRSTDTVGSRDFKKQCVDGQVITEPCQDYRNFLCTETRTQGVDGTFSSASCRINRWRECLANNGKDDSGYDKINDCEKNPDCFIKKVSVPDSKFTFTVCVPKYAPGFNLDKTASSAKDWCNQATQSCTYVKSCDAFGSCTETNAGCLKSGFAEQMNDLCMSLGDCGTKANYIGDVTMNHKITHDGNAIVDPNRGLTAGYVNKLVTYANENLFKNKYITTNLAQFYGNNSIPGLTDSSTTSSGSMLDTFTMVTGGIGIAFYAMGNLAPAALGGFFAYGGGAAGIDASINAGNFVVDESAVNGVTVNMATSAGSAVMSIAAVAGIAYTLYGYAAAGQWAAFAVMTAVAVVATVAVSMIQGVSAAALLTFAGAAAVFPIVGLIVAVIAIILSFLGSTTKIVVKFECQPWQAPLGGAKCSECGKDGFVCSSYACQSLGQNCQLINADTSTPECVNIDPNDVTPPIITANTTLLPDGYIGTEVINGVQIKSSNSDGCISETNQAIPFAIDLNKVGRCKLDTNHSNNYDSMGGIDLDSGLFLSEHGVPISVPSLDSLGLPSFDPRSKANVTFYLRCQDKNGNSNANEYAINFCVKQGNDTTPAGIISRSPQYEKVPFDTTNINASIYLNEPAECRWSSGQNDSYYQMGNNMSCITDLNARDPTTGGWKCSTNFVLPADKNQTTYYIRCLDQPWLTGDNASKRNANTQSYPFNIIRASPLVIENVNADNQTFTFSQDPSTLQVNFSTSGGYDGTALCSFIYDTNVIPLEYTNGLQHSQNFPVSAGEFDEHLICQDRIGSSVEKDIRAVINIRSNAPVVTRTYAQAGTLTITTDEPSTCYYSNDNTNACWFDMSNGTEMTGTNMNSHTTSFDSKQTYYIKCIDAFGHYTGQCNAIVKDGKYE